MYKRFKAVSKDHWWITAHTSERERAGVFVPLELARREGDFVRARGVVWDWYRRECGRTDLSPSAKLIMWALCERWRYETWSSHDAISYYAKMTGVNRKTSGRAMTELIDKEVVWCVLEGEKKRLKKSQPGGKKHFLLVGLVNLL